MDDDRATSLQEAHLSQRATWDLAVAENEPLCFGIFDVETRIELLKLKEQTLAHLTQLCNHEDNFTGANHKSLAGH